MTPERRAARDVLRIVEARKAAWVAHEAAAIKRHGARIGGIAQAADDSGALAGEVSAFLEELGREVAACASEAFNPVRQCAALFRRKAAGAGDWRAAAVYHLAADNLEKQAEEHVTKMIARVDRIARDRIAQYGHLDATILAALMD